VLDFDVGSVAVEGKLTIDGAVLDSKTDYGNVFLRTDAGDEIALGSTATGSYATTVVPGSYDIYYQVGVPLQASLAPLNPRGVVQRGVVFAAGDPIHFDIDIVTTVINGALEIDGAVIGEESDGGRLWLRDGKGDDTPIGWTSTGRYSARVLHGRYGLFYAGTAASSLAPRNTNVELGCLEVP